MSSFRVRVALWSGLLTAGLLVGAGLVLWQVTFAFNLDRLDREVRNIGQANLERVFGPDHWIRLNDALAFVGGNPDRPLYVLHVKREGRVLYESPHWPAQLSPGDFAPGERYEGGAAFDPTQPPPPPRRSEPISERNPALPRRVAQFHTRDTDGSTWRIGVMGNPYVTLLVAVDVREFSDRMTALRNRFLLALPLVLLLAAAGAWWVAGRALRPITVLTRAAETVTARGLNQRIPAMPREREFARLITVFNEMLDRLEKSFQQATRFSADASHELKTPLARLRLELEQAIQRVPPGSPEQETYSSLLDEISRLNAVAQKLLLLSLADAGRLALNCQPVSLSEMVMNVVEDTQAQAGRLRVEHEVAPDILVRADAHLLEQVFQNLASNALKYNEPDGRVRFSLAKTPDTAVVRVANTGPGVAVADRERIFERFVRGDRARSSRVDGTGLGLSLCREIVRAHGGTIELEPRSDTLTVFAVTLPTLTPPPDAAISAKAV